MCYKISDFVPQEQKCVRLSIVMLVFEGLLFCHGGFSFQLYYSYILNNYSLLGHFFFHQSEQNLDLAAQVPQN